METCLELGRQGLTATQISRRTGIARPTVRDWLRGQVPRSDRRRSAGCCRACGHAGHDFAGLPVEYLYLLGIYLGDGCISEHARGVYKLRAFLDAKYPSVIEEVSAAMQSVCPRSRVGRLSRASNFPGGRANDSCFEIFSYSRAWPCLIPQHGRGRKHERPIDLTGWQEVLVERDPRLLLRGLIHSDGCRFINSGRGNWRQARYSFSNLSEGILEIFCRACEAADLHYTRCPRTVYVSRKADVARMDEFVGPKA